MNKNYLALVDKMSVEQKVKLTTGSGLWRTATFPEFELDDLVMTDGTYGVRYNKGQIENGEDSMAGFLSVVNQSADEADSDEEFEGAEGFFGLSEVATCFPNGSSIANSWDVELLNEMGKALAVECRHLGVDILLGPGINIRRTPLAGRGYEYYSEDPILTGELAAGLINGMQEYGVGTSLKHFACNNSEFKRCEMDSIVSERALQEIYLKGFKRAIDKSSPWTIMTSYNLLNGTPTAEHPWLLDTILRKQWGYNNTVMSDWYGTKDRSASLLAGNDLAMPMSERNVKSLVNAVNEGTISEETLNIACYRILSLYEKCHAGREQNIGPMDAEKHHALAQKLAAESIVLLKNDSQLLPLDINDRQKIAVLGEAAQIPVIQGSGCATTRPTMLDCPLDEIIHIAGEHCDIRYAPGMDVDGVANPEQLQRAVTLARESEVAIVFASTAIGEDGENGDRHNLHIIPAHQQLIEAVSEIQSNLVVVVANSDAIVMPWLDKASSVLETFFSGQGMGGAVAECLFGLINPSGKLTVTVPNCLEETPAYLTYPGDNRTHYYSEDIFVGYRYYDKRKMDPLFPFGFGLSYTDFRYSDLRTSTKTVSAGQNLTVTLDVTNTGKRFGKEIVQLYLSAPNGDYAREVLSLKGFAKVALEPNETKRVTIELSWDDFCYFNPESKKWLAEEGKHTLILGRSSRDHELAIDISIESEPYYPPVHIHSSINSLLANPSATGRALTYLSKRTGLPADHLKAKLQELAPYLFFGMTVTLTEMLGVDIDEIEFAAALAEPK
ncbi:beta-glucosidase [Vibrio mediterranei AK1]|uniref:beta-glucosidase family protein n=1 Tax=Vibrio mediterranei TaxID=689 RepID=UPI0001540D36|nr:glycoside hydrolase family 3 C-terminal domain-containing protein [Vibrio mediterranei]EDL55295.1 beta-glucosidase [Vibrio mediterranei AK1]